MAQKRKSKIDEGITWITLSEAARAWGRKSPRGLYFARSKGNVLMRKSAGTWLVRVSDLVKVWGEPIHPIEWGSESMF